MTQAKYIANKLSIIVPCYKVEEYIKECLDSLLHQTYQDIEVIMVDDGSPDHTGDILDEYAQRYANFKAIHTENGGLSAARNAGLPYVTGEYLAFVDSDDVVPLDAYEKMVGSLQQTHSDLATGFVNRFNSKGKKASTIHERAIHDTIYKTNINKNPELVYDTTAWNKVYKSEIFIDNDLKYPIGVTYEDIPVSLKYHLLAKTVDVIADDVYLWRVREGSNQSITQQRANIKMFQDRLKTLMLAKKYLDELNASDVVKKAFMQKVLSFDIPIYLNGFQNADDNTLFNFQEILVGYLKGIDKRLLKNLNIKQQIQYYALLNGDFKTFKKYGFKNNNIGKIILKDNQYIYQNNDISNAIVKEINISNVVSKTKILNVSMHEKEVLIRGELNINNFAKLAKYQFKFKVNIKNISNGKSHEIKSDFKKTNHRRHLIWKTPFYYFNLSLNYNELLSVLGNGKWIVEILAYDHNLKIKTCLSNPENSSQMKLITKSSVIRQIKHFIHISFNKKWMLEIESVDNEINDEQLSQMPWISGFRLGNDILKFDSLIPINLKNSKFILEKKGKKYEGHTLIIKKDSNEVQCEVQFNITGLNIEDGEYNLVMQNKINGGRYHFAYPLRTSVEVILSKGKILTIKHENTKHISIFIANNYVKTSKFDLNTRGLIIEGTLPSCLQSLKNVGLTLVSKDDSETYRKLPININIDCRFLIDLPLYKNNQPIYKAKTYLLYIDGEKDGKEVRIPLTSTKFIKAVKYKKSHFKLLTDDNSQINLDINQKWSWIDNTRGKRYLLQSFLYPLMRLLPIQKNVVLFESLWGRSIDDNPKAIYKYWKDNYQGYKFIWIVDDWAVNDNEDAVVIKRFSFKYWYYLSVAKYIIQNTNMPNGYAKRTGQIELETLHGTFMKTMGFDEPHFKKASSSVQRNFVKRNGRWDFLTSPSKYMDDKVKQAFVYQNKILKVGFPRNDELIKKNNSEFITSKKKNLNIPLNKKIVLYAPTFRQQGKVDFKLDLEKMKEKLSDDYIVLVRLHYLMANAIDIHQFEGFAYDMSSYPDIADLYLISDVLMTDYSSVMFDFGYLKRPMIFFAYDLDWYLDDTNRGVYLDYVKTVPGPIVTNTDEIIDQLNNLNEVSNAYHDKLMKFYDEFCTYGRLGDASQKTVETLLANADMKTAGESGFFTNKLARLLHVSNLSLAFFNFFGQKLKKTNIIIFESNHGKTAEGNPKAMYNYLVKHNPGFELVWVTDTQHNQYFKQHNLNFVNRNTGQGIFKLDRASYWITDNQFPNNWKKPRGLKLVQTTKGPAIKALGNDVVSDYLPGQTIYQYQKSQVIAGRRDNYILAGNLIDASHKKGAYRLTNNQIIMSGNPTTDDLQQISADKQKAIKQKLNIDVNTKVILYEPTWRDNEIVNVDQYGVKNPLDLTSLSEQLPSKTVMLFKYHENIQLGIPNFDKYPNLENVSDYQNNNELLAIADLLITDYSAVMYDFALLNKPMIFYAYDLEQYQKNVHGLYVDDYESFVPGPVVKDEKQLINAIINWNNDDINYQEQLSSFNKIYNEFNDGQVAKKAWKVIFNQEKYQVKNLSEFPDEIQVKDGSMMWNDIYGLEKTKFIGNLDLDDDESIDLPVIGAKVLVDPINQMSFGPKYYQVQIKQDKVWIKGNI